MATSKLAHHSFQTIQLPARDDTLHQDTKLFSTKPHAEEVNPEPAQSRSKEGEGHISSWSWKPLSHSLQDWTRSAQDSQFVSCPLEAHNMQCLSFINVTYLCPLGLRPLLRWIANGTNKVRAHSFHIVQFILLQPKFCFNFYFTFFLSTDITAACSVH